VRDASFFHFIAHQLHDILMHDHGIVGHEGSHSDRIVNGHERLYARTEVAIVLLSEIMGAEVRTFIDQVAVVRDGHGMAATRTSVPMAAERCRSTAESTFKCSPVSHGRCFSMKLLPAARMMSATSKGGRFIPSCGFFP
jgi:hypothetical protein